MRLNYVWHADTAIHHYQTRIMNTVAMAIYLRTQMGSLLGIRLIIIRRTLFQLYHKVIRQKFSKE